MEANKVKEYNEKSISNIAMDSIGQMGNILNKAKNDVIRQLYKEIGIEIYDENNNPRIVSQIMYEANQKQKEVRLIEDYGKSILQVVDISTGTENIIIQCELVYDYNKELDNVELKERWTRV